MGGKARRRASSLSQCIALLRDLDELAHTGAPREELDASFDELFVGYCSLPEAERTCLREAYNHCHSWGGQEFWWTHPSYHLRFKGEGRPRDLRRALAHLSMSDGFPDMRDALLGLGDLMAAAETHGVAWRSVFHATAKVSSLEDSGVGSLRDLLLGLA